MGIKQRPNYLKTLLFTAATSVAINGVSQVDRGTHVNTLKNTSCLLVEKGFVNKRMKASGYKEYFLRCSVQDYFIKFCESEVSKKSLEPLLDKGIEVDMEIFQGEWDSCPSDSFPVQSRTGYYAVIKNVKK